MAARVTLSLMDRLSDQPKSSSIEQFESTLRQELVELLNTKRREEEVPKEFAECRKSILNFGLPDFTSLSMGAAVRKNLEMEIARAITAFEPRLMSVRVEIDPTTEQVASLRFSIQGWMRVDPAPEPITINTVVRTDSFEFSDAGRRRT